MPAVALEHHVFQQQASRLLGLVRELHAARQLQDIREDRWGGTGSIQQLLYLQHANKNIKLLQAHRD